MAGLEKTFKFLTDAPLSFGEDTISFSHAPGAADFSRVALGKVKVLIDHDPSLLSQVGNVLTSRSDGKASFADIQLYDLLDDPLIRKVTYLLDNELHNGLSAGLLNVGPLRKVSKTAYIIDTWQLGEISIVTMPRDPNTETNLSFAQPYVINEDGTREKLSISKHNTASLSVEDAITQYVHFIKRYK